MPIEAGQRLLHYRTTERIGEGGMGVVWKAVDTTLDREVAIKVLPDDFAADPERLARFEREARLLASLNHPHIATLYGLHQAPSTGSGQADVRFLAMELVEGEELAERIARGPVPLDEALQIARQIALALETAHDRGIVHRDLKPANVKRTPDGQIKVLDFGLAKAMDDLAAPTATGSPSMSPTITSAGTVAGMILGTAAYMSPEQAKGEPVDRRADIWAFGVILLELLTGRQAFAAASVPETLAAVLREEPDLNALPPGVPRNVRRALARCLSKDPQTRLHHIADARLELTGQWAGEEPLEAPVAGTRRGLGWPGVAAGVLVGVLLTLGAVMLRGAPDTDPAAVGDVRPTLRSQIDLPAAAHLPLGEFGGIDAPLIALSPDARHLAFVGGLDGKRQLWIRDLTSFDDPRPIRGAEGVFHASFSPDGRSIAFLTNGQINRVSIDGDDLRVLGDAAAGLRATWAEDGWIYFDGNEGTIVRRVPESGGEPETLTRLSDHVLGDVLPHGRSALLHRAAGRLSGDYSELMLLDLRTLEVRPLISQGYDARYLASGHLLFARGGNLLAVAFDADTGTVSGEPVTVARGVAMDSFFDHAQVAVSRNGTVAYVPGADRAIGRIAWVDRRTGEEHLLPVEPALYGVLDLDQQDRRLAVHVGDVNDYIWIYDLESGIGQKLTGSQGAGRPIWSPSGDRIVYSRSEGDRYTLVVHEIGGRSEPREIFAHDSGIAVGSWSPDGSLLAVQNFWEGRLAVVPLDDPDQVEWIQSADANYAFPYFSSDGKWLAYMSDESGLQMPWVRSWPEGTGVRPIFDVWAGEPIWCWRTDEVFFRNNEGWFASRASLAGGLSLEPPRRAFAFPDDFLDTPGRSYDVSSDGQRLFIVKRAQPYVRDRIHLIANLDAELRRRLPGG